MKNNSPKNVFFSSGELNINGQKINNLNDLSPEQQEQIKAAMSKLSSNPMLSKLLGGGTMDIINSLYGAQNKQSSKIIDVETSVDSIKGTDNRIESDSTNLLNQNSSSTSNNFSSNSSQSNRQSQINNQYFSSNNNPAVKSDRGRNMVLMGVIIFIILTYLQFKYGFLNS